MKITKIHFPQTLTKTDFCPKETNFRVITGERSFLPWPSCFWKETLGFPFGVSTPEIVQRDRTDFQDDPRKLVVRVRLKQRKIRGIFVCISNMLSFPKVVLSRSLGKNCYVHLYIYLLNTNKPRGFLVLRITYCRLNGWIVCPSKQTIFSHSILHSILIRNVFIVIS